MSRYWNPILETMPIEDLQCYQLSKFKEICMHAYNNSVYYRQKFTKAGLNLKELEDIKTINDVNKIPITTKNDLILAQKDKEPFPYGELLAAPPEQIIRYHQTSGTTGSPLRWGDTWSDWEWMADAWATCLYFRDLTERDRVYIAFPYHVSIAFWAGHYGVEKIGAEVIPGGSTSTEQRIREIADLRCTALLCTPSYVLHMAEVAKQMGIDLRKTAIEKIICTGESGASNQLTKKRIEESWDAKVYDHAGATEAPQWSFQCQERRGLHLNEAHYLVEVLNPETFKPVTNGEVGTVIVTNLIRKGIPAIRYDLKDLIKLSALDEKCPCGRTWRIAEGGLQGRRDELTKIRGILFSPKNVGGVITKFPELSSEHEIILTRKNDYDNILVKVEILPQFDQQISEIETRLTRELRNATSLRCDVEFVPFNSLPRSETKAKRLKDLRVF